MISSFHFSTMKGRSCNSCCNIQIPSIGVSPFYNSIWDRGASTTPWCIKTMPKMILLCSTLSTFIASMRLGGKSSIHFLLVSISDVTSRGLSVGFKFQSYHYSANYSLRIVSKLLQFFLEFIRVLKYFWLVSLHFIIPNRIRVLQLPRCASKLCRRWYCHIQSHQT